MHVTDCAWSRFDVRTRRPLSSVWRSNVLNRSASCRCWTEAERLSTFERHTLEDRKSTRLNSSHVKISYAVFCLICRPPGSPLFPYTTLFRSLVARARGEHHHARHRLRVVEIRRQDAQAVVECVALKRAQPLSLLSVLDGS